MLAKPFLCVSLQFFKLYLLDGFVSISIINFICFYN